MPAAAIALVVLSSYLARAPDIVAARVYGGPPGPDLTLSWRVVVSLRDRGFYEPVAGLPVTLEVVDVLSHGVTDNEGAWEARVALPPDTSGEVDIAVRQRDSGRLLLSARVPVRPAQWRSSFRRVEPEVPGRRSGSLRVELALHRAFLATSFPERALVRVSREGRPVGAASLRLEGDGVSFGQEQPRRTDEHGRAWITLVPTFPAATVQIDARHASGDEGRLQCVLPVQTGAMWIDPHRQVDGTITIVSPVGHRVAYLTLFTERARLFGRRVTLERDESSGAQGTMTLPQLVREPVWLMVSPDPPGMGQEASLLGWPMLRDSEAQPTAAARVTTALLADGRPEALAAAKERARAGRLRALIILMLGAMIEAALLWSRARHAKLELERLLRCQDEVDEALTRALLGGWRFWFTMVIASLLLAIAFGALTFVMWVGVF